MAGEPDKNVESVAEKSAIVAAGDEKPKDEKKSKDGSKKKKEKGFLARLWNGLFGSRKDDFERRLERISKEEKIIISRMRRRAQNWGSLKRNIILFSVLLEIVAVGYAIMTARTAENWKIRAFRVLPMFLLPALSAIIFSGLSSFISMRERKDQKTLEKLQTERQSKIDELKERTNFYLTQQLIQRYDTDPAAKAAAAAVLASKYTEGTGLKLSLPEESEVDAGKSNDVELVQSSGLRNRKQPQGRGTSPGGTTIQHPAETYPQTGSEYAQQNQQVYVDHFQGQGATAYNSGWLSRIAAVLVGEDPTQCYALICGNCHMHNGLASKEDFPYVTYICPHCHAVNGPRIQQERSSGTDASNMGSVVSADHGHATTGVDSPHDSTVDDVNGETVSTPALAKVGEKTEIPAEGNES
ncbi:uncharacterized protein At2g24330-like [Chenopodium quinoa]|uniref:Lunapark zinc ribbon domain-containing protein n=1 Tax=Chenopodium quinoa TaxID=63459 RepID=A0A803MU79_CHEQI|nr:uncharacterized protein At2g24330-like [Chenopodium quinoa]